MKKVKFCALVALALGMAACNNSTAAGSDSDTTVAEVFNDSTTIIVTEAPDGQVDSLSANGEPVMENGKLLDQAKDEIKDATKKVGEAVKEEGKSVVKEAKEKVADKSKELYEKGKEGVKKAADKTVENVKKAL